MSQIVKIDPKEFGLEENQVLTIEQAFLPKITERDELSKIYSELIKKEVTPESCKEAKQLRLKLVKVRTGIAEIHKTQKAFFLAAGKFVDAWKNKETTPVEQMEAELQKHETYYERLEEERIAKLQAERLAKISLLTSPELIPNNIGSMREEVFQAYLTGLQVAHDAKIEKERKEAEAIEQAKIEAERKVKLHKERKDSLVINWTYLTPEQRTCNFAEMSEVEYNDLFSKVTKLRADYEAEQERIRIENERLKAEQEQKAKELETERKKQAEILKKQKEESDAKLKAEREQKEKLEAELKAKEEAEEKAKKEAELKAETERKAAEKAAKAPVKTQMIKWVNSFTLPEIAIQNEAEKTIRSKFESFKKWAKSEIEKL